jgi:hypothetical protein
MDVQILLFLSSIKSVFFYWLKTIFLANPKLSLSSSAHILLIKCCQERIVSRDSAVAITNGYKLDDREFRSSSPGGGQEFSLHYVVQTGSGVYRAS